MCTKALGGFLDFLAGGSSSECESTQTTDATLCFADLPSHHSILPFSAKRWTSFFISDVITINKTNFVRGRENTQHQMSSHTWQHPYPVAQVCTHGGISNYLFDRSKYFFESRFFDGLMTFIGMLTADTFDALSAVLSLLPTFSDELPPLIMFTWVPTHCAWLTCGDAERLDAMADWSGLCKPGNNKGNRCESDCDPGILLGASRRVAETRGSILTTVAQTLPHKTTRSGQKGTSATARCYCHFLNDSMC